MYSVLLVDDEHWALEDLRSMLDFNALGFHIIGQASDGAAALMLAKRHKPDLIITDIKMPNMSGLELLEAINKAYKYTLTVFVSAFGEFELARQAVVLGAFDYILKPVEKDHLEKLLVRVGAALAQKHTERENAVKIALMDYINKLMENTAYNTQVVNLVQSGIETSDRKFFVAVLQKKSSCPFDIRDFFDNVWCCSIPIGERRDCLIFSQKNGERFSNSGVKRLCRALKAMDATMGVSRPIRNLNKLENAFGEANVMMEQRFITGIDKGLYYYRKQNGLVKLTVTRDSLPDLIKKLYVKFKNKKINIEGALHIYNQIITVARPTTDLTIGDSKSLADMYADVNEMLAFLSGSLIEQVDELGDGINEKIVKVVDYVNQNFDKKLLISELSKKFHFNASYLSVLFKKYMGKSFTDYLIDIRFSKAKEMLQNTDLSLYKIAEMVGYENYFHFSKLFKKYEGVTPMGFRKNH